MLLLALGLLLVAGCCKKPNDSKPKSKWVILNEGREIDARRIAFADSMNGRAIRGGVYSFTHWRTEEGGRSWELDSVPLHPHLSEFYDLAFVSRANVWLVGGDGLIYHTLDGGQTRIVDDRLYAPPGLSPIIKKIFFPDSLHGWIWYLGYHMYDIARTADGGQTWQVVSRGKYLLQALNGEVAFAEAGEGILVRTLDGGTTWHEIYTAEPQSWGGISHACFISPDEGLVVLTWESEYSSISYFMRTADGGMNWDTLYTLSDGGFGEIQMLPSREGWVLARDGIWHTSDGTTWQEEPLPDVGDRPIGNLFVLPSGEAWLTAGGLVLRRQD